MKTELANYLNAETKKLKARQKHELCFTDDGIIGRQYKHRRSAERAIRNYKVKWFATIPKHFQLWVIEVDKGVFQVDGMED